MEDSSQLELVFYFPDYNEEIKRKNSKEDDLDQGDCRENEKGVRELFGSNKMLKKIKLTSKELYLITKNRMAKVYFTRWVFDFSNIIHSLNNFQ